MNNVKTTIFGALAAIGGYLAQSTTGTLQLIGQLVGGAATFLLGAAAKDASNKN